MDHKKLVGSAHSLIYVMAQGIPQIFASTLILVILLMIFVKKVTCYVYPPEPQHRKELKTQMEAGML